MSTIIINADDKIMKELAKRLDATVVNMKDGQYENFLQTILKQKRKN